ncbi:MAG: GTPase HflX [Endomicrobia bacterium]|nr:GTPase HflX [Endomicrobiia bacterium]MCL2507163.1 GTPase HflX [Endomicrobiia bacterium]
MEKVILVGVQTKDKTRQDTEKSLDELESLCLTDGARTIDKVIQKRDVPDSAYFIGHGKALEIKEMLENLKADAVVFDDALKPVQQRNLEKLIEKKVVDRTRIILDIFAYRARTKEGKLQVERAEMTYHAARLASQGIHLDSQTGGIGTRRGPGERKIETDKRKIRDRIAELDREIEKIKERRDIQRNLRDNSDLPEIAIAGYTNAGKSTLLATLSKSKVYADDKLFATLDPLTRKIRLPGGRDVLLTDTVGFINKLPHDLVAAFRSTMEEILRAKCILHVIDASNPDRKKQIETVLNVLKDIGADNIPVITVFNKADKLDEQEKFIFNTHDVFLISAKNSSGVEKLLTEIEKRVVPLHSEHKIKVSYEHQDKVGVIYKLANVKSEKYNRKSTELTVECSDENWEKIKNLIKD